MSKIPEIPGWNPAVHRLTTVKEEIKEAAIVVCVTNAVGGILQADDFGANTVILDDAQPENVDISVLDARPDLRVVKCLTRIPGLHCPFEMGLFAAEHLDPEVNFTCLAEIILSAAERHPASCVVGDPTDEQLQYLERGTAAWREACGVFQLPEPRCHRSWRKPHTTSANADMTQGRSSPRGKRNGLLVRHLV